MEQLPNVDLIDDVSGLARHHLMKKDQMWVEESYFLACGGRDAGGARRQ